MPKVLVTAAPDEGITVTVIDTSDWVGWTAAQFRLGEYNMTDTKSFVKAVLKASKKGKIRRLNIMDHGNPYGFELGSDFIRSETFSSDEDELGKISGVFHKRGWVHLWGCNTGLARKLMKQLAKLWGVPVVSGTGKQHALFRFNTGTFIECHPNGACRSQ